MQLRDLPFKLKEKKKILIIDDFYEYIEILSRTLSRFFLIEKASTIAEGRDKYLRFSPDLLIVDFHLEDGLGTEFIQEIGGKKGERPVIFLHTGIKLKRAAFIKVEKKIDKVVPKPIASNELADLCHEWLSNADMEKDDQL